MCSLTIVVHRSYCFADLRQNLRRISNDHLCLCVYVYVYVYVCVCVCARARVRACVYARRYCAARASLL